MADPVTDAPGTSGNPLQGLVSGAGQTIGAVASGNPLGAIAPIFGGLINAFSPGPTYGGGVSDSGAIAPTVTSGGLFGIGRKVVPGVLGPAPEAVYAPTPPAQQLMPFPQVPQAAPAPTPQMLLPMQARAIQNAVVAPAPVAQATPTVMPAPAVSVPAQAAPLAQPAVPASPVQLQAAVQYDDTPLSAAHEAPPGEQTAAPEPPQWLQEVQQVLPGLQQKFGAFFNSLDPLAALDPSALPPGMEQAAGAANQNQGTFFNPLKYMGGAATLAAPTPAAVTAPTAVPANKVGPKVVPAPPNNYTSVVPETAAGQPQLVAQTPKLAPSGDVKMEAVKTDHEPTVGDAKAAANNAASVIETQNLGRFFDAIRKAPITQSAAQMIVQLAQNVAQAKVSNVSDFERLIDAGMRDVNKYQQDLTNEMNKQFTEPQASLGGHSRLWREAYLLGKIAALHNDELLYATKTPSDHEWHTALNAQMKTDATGKIVRDKFGNPEVGAYEPPIKPGGPLGALQWAIGHPEVSKKQIIADALNTIMANRHKQVELNKGIVDNLSSELTQYQALEKLKDLTIQTKVTEHYKRLMDELGMKEKTLAELNGALALPLSSYIAAQSVQTADTLKELHAAADVAVALAQGGNAGAKAVGEENQTVKQIADELKGKNEMAARLVAESMKPGHRVTPGEEEMRKALVKYIQSPPTAFQTIKEEKPPQQQLAGTGVPK
jgi:hypothetical protein